MSTANRSVLELGPAALRIGLADDGGIRAVARDELKRTPALQAQFGSLESFLGFLKSRAAGRGMTVEEWGARVVRVERGVALMGAEDLDAEIERLWNLNYELPDGRRVKTEFGGDKGRFTAWAKNDPKAPAELGVALAT